MVSSNNRQTIIYVGSIMLPDKNAAAQRALSLSKSLRDLGYRVIIVGRGEVCNRNNSIISTHRIIQGFDTYMVPNPSSTKQWIHHTLSASEYIEIIKYYGISTIKCVLVMEYESVPLMKLLNFCHSHKIPLAADSLEWYGPSTRAFPINYIKDVDTCLRMRLIYPFLTKNMICISRFLTEHYKKYIQNVVYIPGSIDPSEKKWISPPYQANTVFTIGYAGNPGKHFEKERVDLLIRAVNELNQERKPCRLLLAGIDESFLRNNEHIGAAYLQSNGMIVCKGALSHLESLNLISSCDFSTIIRDSNRVTSAGFPTKLSESFGCGTPVLATKTSNIAEYIPNLNWGMVCSECSVLSIKAMIEHAMRFSPDHLSTIHKTIKQDNPLIFPRFNSALKNFIDNLIV